MASNLLQSILSYRPCEKKLPSFDELPKFHDMSGCAWGVWGDDDQLGTVNLLTEKVVRRAAKEEIRTGKNMSLNWPLNFPEKPIFQRNAPQQESHIVEGRGFDALRDETLHINTSTGSQWDGMKHFGIIEHDMYYNKTPSGSIPVGPMSLSNPLEVDPAQIKLGIHNWAQHGICGRGVLLDLVRYFSSTGTPIDPWATRGITVDELEACAKQQGVKFRQGDILLIRMGFIEKYYASSQDEKACLNGFEAFAGIDQSEDMKRFLWNNHFSAVASDQPTLERWPTVTGTLQGALHNTILGLWGMPLGELFDLEALSTHCSATKRYTFFFSSWPLNVLGGVASPPNAAAYF